MNVTIVDYNSGNISSVINSFKEVAKDKVNIEVTSDLNKIKSADKVVLPGQGSFKSCIDALNNIGGLVDTLHVENIYGDNSHHIIESCFKGLARSLRTALEIDPRNKKTIPSTKGSL